MQSELIDKCMDKEEEMDKLEIQINKLNQDKIKLQEKII